MELSGSEASSAIDFRSDNEAPEDPVEEPIYLGRKREKFYKIIIERGEGLDKPGTIDEVVIRYCSFAEELSSKPFETVTLGKGILPEYLEKGLVSMKKNEIADLHVPADLSGTEDIIVKVELSSFINIHDLHANGMLIKKVLNKSSGIDRISVKDEIVIDLLITQDSQVLYEKKNINIIVGVSDIPEGIVEILKTMKINEISETNVKFEYFTEKFKYPTFSNSNPLVKIEILALHKVTDIYVNGGFYKKTLSNGNNEMIYPNSQIEFEYTLEYTGYTCSEKITSYLDDSYLPSLWQDTLKLMKVGEYSKIECFENEKSENLRDSLTEKFNSPSNTPVLYFRVIQVISGGPVYEMDESQKLSLAIRMKVCGSELFKKGLFTRAIEKYDTGLGALNPVKDHLDIYKDTFISLQLNIALCFFKIKEYSNSIIRCDRILEVEPSEIKTIFRKGMNLKMMFEYKNAIEIFEKGKQIAYEKKQDNSIGDFDKEIKHSQELLQSYFKKEKKIYSNLFK